MNGDAGAGTEGLIRQMVYGFLILFYAIVYVVTAKAGLSGGASFFSMADANLIFTGPVAVSYTHLDVYKRQSLLRSMTRLHKCDSFSSFLHFT